MRYAIFAIILALVSTIYSECQEDKGIKITPRRVALVIGNADYQNLTKLKNTVNDARDMKLLLEKLEFEVIERLDADKEAMESALEQFAEKLKRKEALFYYSGHGVQVSGVNYLVPVDAKVTNEKVLKVKSVSADDLLAYMDEAKTRVVILDACREDPFSGRSLSKKGLAEMGAGKNSIIVFATGPGQMASDLSKNGRNGVFTQYLLQYMNEPAINISECMMKVRTKVLAETGDEQSPWEHSSLTEPFYFNKITEGKNVPEPGNSEKVKPPSSDSDGQAKKPTDMASEHKNERDMWTNYRWWIAGIAAVVMVVVWRRVRKKEKMSELIVGVFLGAIAGPFLGASGCTILGDGVIPWAVLTTVILATAGIIVVAAHKESVWKGFLGAIAGAILGATGASFAWTALGYTIIPWAILATIILATAGAIIGALAETKGGTFYDATGMAICGTIAGAIVGAIVGTICAAISGYGVIPSAMNGAFIGCTGLAIGGASLSVLKKTIVKSQ